MTDELGKELLRESFVRPIIGSAVVTGDDGETHIVPAQIPREFADELNRKLESGELEQPE